MPLAPEKAYEACWHEPLTQHSAHLCPRVHAGLSNYSVHVAYKQRGGPACVSWTHQATHLLFFKVLNDDCGEEVEHHYADEKHERQKVGEGHPAPALSKLRVAIWRLHKEQVCMAKLRCIVACTMVELHDIADEHVFACVQNSRHYEASKQNKRDLACSVERPYL